MLPVPETDAVCRREAHAMYGRQTNAVCRREADRLIICMADRLMLCVAERADR